MVGFTELPGVGHEDELVDTSDDSFDTQKAACLGPLPSRTFRLGQEFNCPEVALIAETCTTSAPRSGLTMNRPVGSSRT